MKHRTSDGGKIRVIQLRMCCIHVKCNVCHTNNLSIGYVALPAQLMELKIFTSVLTCVNKTISVKCGSLIKIKCLHSLANSKPLTEYLIH